MSLLDDLDELRQRTRDDRRAYAFPLFLFGALVLLSPVLYASMRTGWPRTAGVAVAAFLATVFFGAVGAYLIRGYAALVIIAAALLVLAWVERSVLLAVVMDRR